MMRRQASNFERRIIVVRELVGCRRAESDTRQTLNSVRFNSGYVILKISDIVKYGAVIPPLFRV